MKHLLYWLFWVVFGAGFIGVFWLFAPVSLAMLALAGMMLFVGALIHCLRHGPIARCLLERHASLVRLVDGPPEPPVALRR